MIELSQVDNSRLSHGDHVVLCDAPNQPTQEQKLLSKGKATKLTTFLACVATVAVFASTALLTSSSSNTTTATPTSSIQQDIHFDLKTLEPLKFHQSGFGALNFHHHENGGNKYRRFLSSSQVKIPVSAVEHAIPSLGEKNIMNLSGHYVHDETRSPWSSILYNRPKEELIQEQKEYLEKMHKVRQEWGSWNFKDHSDAVRPVQDLSRQAYRDIKNVFWSKNVWQTDKKYVEDLIQEGRKLVDRMTEGIYAEFGFPTKKKDGSKITAEEMSEREEIFKIHITEETNNALFPQGFARIRQAGFDALVRKLLHAMITNDDFYFVLGGHSAAAGHGNDHAQQKTMQFNNIMEPVFHKLGIRLISRNLAMGGLGTLHFSAGQAELYGEKDFLMWDSAMTEKTAWDTDLFNKQAIMNGERVPIIMTLFPNNIVEETGGKAWIGDILPNHKYLPETEDEEQGRTLPWLVQFQNCAAGVSLCGGNNMIDKFDAKCWVERKDAPDDGKNIRLDDARGGAVRRTPGAQSSWHPGWRGHRIESRKAAILFLEAFKKAFDVWDEGIKADGFPLAEKYWHVGPIYTDIKKTFHDFITGEAKGTSACEKHYDELGYGEWCRVGMHGMSSFRPINRAQENGIVRHIKAPPSGWAPKPEYEDYYTGPDLLPLSWKIPDGDVDVHAIAIATSYEATFNENLFHDDNDDENIEDAELSRMLRTTSTNDEVDLSSHRSLESSEIVQGEGWGIEGAGTSETEYCDGSAQSECGRLNLNHNGDCAYQDKNDRRNTISGDGLSGWLVMTIPGEVTNGIIWAKLEWWHPRNNWHLTPLNDSSFVPPEKKNILCGGCPYELPDDFKLDIAINGKIYDTWDKDKFMSNAKAEVAYNEAIYRFATNDPSVNGKNVELALRMSSASNPKGAGVGVAHIYWS